MAIYSKNFILQWLLSLMYIYFVAWLPSYLSFYLYLLHLLLCYSVMIGVSLATHTQIFSFICNRGGWHMRVWKKIPFRLNSAFNWTYFSLRFWMQIYRLSSKRNQVPSTSSSLIRMKGDLGDLGDLFGGWSAIQQQQLETVEGFLCRLFTDL